MIVASVLGFTGKLMAPLSGVLVLVSSLLASATGLLTTLVNSIVRIATTLVSSLLTPWGLIILMILTGTSFMFWMKYFKGARQAAQKKGEKEISEAIYTAAQDFVIRDDANLTSVDASAGLDAQFPKIDF